LSITGEAELVTFNSDKAAAPADNEAAGLRKLELFDLIAMLSVALVLATPPVSEEDEANAVALLFRAVPVSSGGCGGGGVAGAALVSIIELLALRELFVDFEAFVEVLALAAVARFVFVAAAASPFANESTNFGFLA